jgi:glycosyltransferase involved in cell wall biosynthesis
MAMKKPVIGTDVGSLKEVIINEVTGFLIKPKNVEELSEKMILLCNNKKMLSFLGENAMKFIEKDYSSEKMFEKLENLYEKLSS